MLQLRRKEQHLCAAMAERFVPGSHMPPARDSAERRYAEALAQIGRECHDYHVLTIAAEGYLNLLPWDYIQVCVPQRSAWRQYRLNLTKRTVDPNPLAHDERQGLLNLSLAGYIYMSIACSAEHHFVTGQGQLIGLQPLCWPSVNTLMEVIAMHMPRPAAGPC